MVNIVNMKDYSDGLEKRIAYYHDKWGATNNFNYFHDAMIHSSNSMTGLPRFYLLLNNDTIIGCCGLIINDFISRHDLFPWLCGLFIEENERGNSLGNMLMNYAENESMRAGYKNI